MTTLLETTSITLNASAAALAWSNAFIATGSADERPILFRTLSVEFYRSGVQFIGCDGQLLFRTFVPKEGTDEWPEDFEVPDASVVVLDRDHFALSFIKALVSATKGDTGGIFEIAMAIEPAPEPSEEIPLGAEFSTNVLTLRALGQQLHCRLYEHDYVNWRQALYGVPAESRVDGMHIATRMFTAVGKLKDVGSVECSFAGDDKAIRLVGERSFRGLMMPMVRRKKRQADDETDEQTDALDRSERE